MDVKLLFKDTEERHHKRTVYEQHLMKDLKMSLILEQMAGENPYLYQVCEEVLTDPLVSENEILWRQAVVKEAVKLPKFFNKMYEIASTSLEKIETYREFTAPKYDQIVKNAKKLITETEILEILIDQLERVGEILESEAVAFQAEALICFNRRFMSCFTTPLIEEVKRYIHGIKQTKESTAMLLTGHLSLGIKRHDFILNTLHVEDVEGQEKDKIKFWNRLFKEKEAGKEKNSYQIMLDSTTLENNAKDLMEANLGEIYKVLSRFNKQLIAYFEHIKYQFGFLSCCSQLYQQMKAMGANCCYPTFDIEHDGITVRELVDIGLMIKGQDQRVVGNTLSEAHKKLWLITGANQGGKTTFLRSMGLALLMAQCGLFVGAAYYQAKVFNGIFTHFPSEEDLSVNKGLLEVELSYLDDIVSVIKTDSILLMNESFATTTEEEGSKIAEELTKALRECGVQIIFVTHLFQYADALYQEQPYDVAFFEAGRDQTGSRNYQISKGRPRAYGNGIDLLH